MPIIRVRGSETSVDAEGKPVSFPRVDPTPLLQRGPVIAACLAPPENASLGGAALPVQGIALIDTGAGSTCVDIDCAEKAGMPVRGVGHMSSASHEAVRTPLFAGVVQLPGINLEGAVLMGARLLQSQGLIALIGRDMLAHCLFVYDGKEGSYKLAW